MALTKRVEVLFDAELFAKLEEVARAEGQSVGALVRRAVERQYLQPSVEERKRAVKDLLRLNLHIGTWEEVKEDLLRIRASDVETP